MADWFKTDDQLRQNIDLLLLNYQQVVSSSHQPTRTIMIRKVIFCSGSPLLLRQTGMNHPQVLIRTKGKPDYGLLKALLTINLQNRQNNMNSAKTKVWHRHRIQYYGQPPQARPSSARRTKPKLASGKTRLQSCLLPKILWWAQIVLVFILMKWQFW